MRFQDKVVWITGASSGIGEALAQAFAREGAILILSSRRTEELERVKLSCPAPERHHIVPLDLEQPASLTAAVERSLSLVKGVDLLVNNGGLSQRSLALETKTEVERRLMEIDFFGQVILSKALLPSMLARGTGRLVVISSVMGYVGTPMRSSYAAAKHALHGYFDSLRAELHGTGVGVTIACPGYVRTRVSHNALTADGAPQGRQDRPQGRGIEPARCAKAILKAVAAGRDEVHVGGKEIAGIYLKRFLPFLFTRIVRRMNFGQTSAGKPGQRSAPKA